MNTQGSLDLTPQTNQLWAEHQRAKFSWSLIISELVDNSFDAGANSVRLAFEPKGRGLSVLDDGVGCSDLSLMLSQGGHKKHATTKLGRYGVGGKDAALALWGRIQIDSCSGGKLRMVDLEWESVVKSGVWDAADETQDASDANCRRRGLLLGRGTKITYTGIKRKYDKGTIAKLNKDLGFTFSPLLAAGRSIVIEYGKTTSLVKPLTFPECEEIIEVSGQIGPGKYRARVGIVADGTLNPKSGFTFCFEDQRVIDTNSEPCGAEYSSARVFGWVMLDDGWVLARNKDAIEGTEELYRELHTKCEGLLRRADEKGADMAMADVGDRLASMLKGALASGRKTRATRGRGGTAKGTRKRTGTGGLHRKARATQAALGNIIEKVSGNVKVEWHDALSNGYAEFEAGTTLRVKLCRTNSFLASIKNDPARLELLCVGVLSALAVSLSEDQQRQVFMSFYDEPKRGDEVLNWQHYFTNMLWEREMATNGKV